MRYFGFFLVVLSFATLTFGEPPVKDREVDPFGGSDPFSGDGPSDGSYLSRGVKKDSPKRESWHDALERGYHADSQKPLVAFLKAWHANSKPVAAELLNKKLPFEQEVYKIFGLLFKPDEKAYRDTQYLLVQKEIDVVVVNSSLDSQFDPKTEYGYRDLDRIRQDKRGLIDMETGKPVYGDNEKIEVGEYEIHLVNDREDLWHLKTSEVVVKDFRPPVKFEGKKILYLQDKYLRHLVRFLTENKGHGNLLRGERYWEEECGSEERGRRLEYLNKRLLILPGHWGRGWVFASYPTITRIYFSSDLNRAIVHYRAPFYRGGRALLEKDAQGVWKIVWMKILWQE